MAEEDLPYDFCGSVEENVGAAVLGVGCGEGVSRPHWIWLPPFQQICLIVGS